MTPSNWERYADLRTIAGLIVCVSGAVHAQPAAAPRFEVASIKPTPADQYNGSSGITTGHDRLTGSRVTLKRCIMGAYGVGPNQLGGGPAWLDSDRFEIAAKADHPVDDDAAFMAMLQTLMAERFKLAIHRETRTMEALVLEVTRNGPKLEKTEGGDSHTDSSHGRIDAKATNMTLFAQLLSRAVGVPVVNETGLDGAFNFKLEWSPESDKPGENAMDSGPSIFAALQQQLGLRLQSRKTPVEVLVIDHAERPSEN
ncbi:MAG: TIGR03435 family protein [Bryobacteraceae bacterium]